MTENPAPSNPGTSPTAGVDPGPTAGMDPASGASPTAGTDRNPTAGLSPSSDTTPTAGTDPGRTAGANPSPDLSPAASEDPGANANPTAAVDPRSDTNPTASPEANATAAEDRGSDASPTAGVDPGPDLSRLRWTTPEPGRLLGRGHTAGDFLEAYEWRVLERRPGYLRVEAGLPAHVRNPRGQLFGGFTPTYVDLVALFTVRVGTDDADGMPRSWLATTQMRLDYFEPITGPQFVIESELEKKRGRTNFVLTRFFQGEALAVLAATTIREVPMDRPLGDA